MERPVLTAQLRLETGKGIARKLRAKGLIPAILYGPRAKSTPLIVSRKELIQTLGTEAGGNVLIDLEIKDGENSSRKVVMVKEVQYDYLQKEIFHTDFYEVAMDVMVTVEIPIHLIGKPEGAKLGGILEQIRRVVEIQCLPGDIPNSIEVDVSALKIGDSIHISDIKFDKGKILSDPGETIATVLAPIVEEKKVEEVAAEAPLGEEVKEKE
ncbi:MAG: 50S ribosomal protein L25 [Thermodesulfobacteriota bacterium]